jgi:hypothetical protein
MTYTELHFRNRGRKNLKCKIQNQCAMFSFKSLRSLEYLSLISTNEQMELWFAVLSAFVRYFHVYKFYEHSLLCNSFLTLKTGDVMFKFFYYFLLTKIKYRD